MTNFTDKSVPQAANAETSKRLLDEAMKRPGVRELVEICEQVRRFEDAAAEYRAALCPQPEEWASASSSPS